MNNGPLMAAVPVFFTTIVPLKNPVRRLKINPNLVVLMLATSTWKLPNVPVGIVLPTESLTGEPPRVTE